VHATWCMSMQDTHWGWPLLLCIAECLEDAESPSQTVHRCWCLLRTHEHMYRRWPCS
jgi:hypothetical protein